MHAYKNFVYFNSFHIPTDSLDLIDLIKTRSEITHNANTQIICMKIPKKYLSKVKLELIIEIGKSSKYLKGSKLKILLKFAGKKARGIRPPDKNKTTLRAARSMLLAYVIQKATHPIM